MPPKSYTYPFPRPMLTVDAVIFRETQSAWEVLLIQRGGEPFAGKWALPGGFIEMEETLEVSALRELAEETGITRLKLEQFRTYGDPGRDPRGRTISVVFIGIAPAGTMAEAGDDASDALWFRVNELPDLAFDHRQVVLEAFAHIFG